MLNIPEKIKELLKNDNVRKSYRISFPNGELADITGEHIVQNSVTFVESLASNHDFRFGLCESSRFSFQTDVDANIKGCEFEATLEVDTSGIIEFRKDEVSIKGYSSKFEVFNMDCEGFGGESWQSAMPYNFYDIVPGTGLTVAVDAKKPNIKKPSDVEEYVNAPNIRFEDITIYLEFKYLDGSTKDVTISESNVGLSTFFNIDVSAHKKGELYPTMAALTGGNIQWDFTYSIRNKVTGDIVDYSEKVHTDIFIYQGAFISHFFPSSLGEKKNDVSYPVYSIPMGTFIVDDCKRDFNTGLRTVSAYSPSICGDVYTGAQPKRWEGLGFSFAPTKGTMPWYWTQKRKAHWTGISPIEAHKMNLSVRRNSKYRFDLMSFLMSCIPSASAGFLNLISKKTPSNITKTETKTVYATTINEKTQRIKVVSEFDVYEIFNKPDNANVNDFYNDHGTDLFYISGFRCIDRRIEIAKWLEGQIAEFTKIPNYMWNSAKNTTVQNSLQDVIEKHTGTGETGAIAKVMCNAYIEYSAGANTLVNPPTPKQLVSDERIIYPYVHLNNADKFVNCKLYIPKSYTVYFLDSEDAVQKTAVYEFKKAEIYSANALSSFSKTVEFKRNNTHTNGYVAAQSNVYLALGYKEGEKWDMREFVEGWTELSAQFGLWDRTTNGFSFVDVERNLTRLYPSDSLRPSDELTPNGASVYIPKQMQTSTWIDDGKNLPFGRAVCNFKPLAIDPDATIPSGETEPEEENIVKYVGDVTAATFDEDSMLTYDFSDNFIINNLTPSIREVNSYAEKIANALNGIQYMPVNLTLHGLPYIEAGDWVEVASKFGTYAALVLSHSMKGEYNLVSQITAE